ncbi:MAG: heme-binding protein [Dokdonella sp.]
MALDLAACIPFVGIRDADRSARIDNATNMQIIRNHMIASATLICALVGSSAMAVEEPAFKTVLKDGTFEVRDYPALVVAEVTVSGEQKEAASKGFRLLAAYIFGGNTRRQSIAMTAPVAQEPTSEKIAMTAPVTQILNAGTWTVRFTMPSTYTLDTLPDPNDPKVQLRKLPPARFSVLRFSGLASKSDVDAKSDELIAATTSHHFNAMGPVSLAQYNPPWTLWFMRRNEVMVSVERAP